jgi:DNA-binding MarR family transcriptional regulator
MAATRVAKTSSSGEVAPVQRALEQLNRLRASRRAHAGLTVATGVDLSQPAYVVLRRVHEYGPITLGELARLAEMDAASTGRQVRRLEELGLIERSSVDGDARVTQVRITPRGAATRDRIAAVLEAHLHDALATWSARDRRELGHLLTRLVDDLRALRYRGVDEPADPT